MLRIFSVNSNELISRATISHTGQNTFSTLYIWRKKEIKEPFTHKSILTDYPHRYLIESKYLPLLLNYGSICGSVQPLA